MSDFAPVQDLLDTIESAVTLAGHEVSEGDSENSLTVLGNEADGVNYRIVIEPIAK